MSSNSIIQLKNVNKEFHVFSRPSDRLKQLAHAGIRRYASLPHKKYYQEFHAIKNVSFEIFKGETVGIVGRNGSGKSTILQIICGVLNQTSGSVNVNGRIAALLELGSGFNPEFTGRENIYLNASILGLSKEEIDSKYDAIVEFADIGDFIEQPVKSYSSGMVVRLAFAVSINVSPDILIIDEALAVGDELFQRKCYGKIDEIKKSGATILFVSHSGSTIIELCDRAILLDSGEKIAEGKPKQVISYYHKLLYSPRSKFNEIKSQILELVSDSSEKSADSENKKNTISELESYDPHLKPTTTINYESSGAKIKNVRVLNKDNKIINNLTKGHSYKFCYDVDFTDDLQSVRFGMMIKTTTGFELGGAVSSNPLNAVELVKSGSVVSVSFDFKCNLTPTTYFLNCGVLAQNNGCEAFAHRIVDAMTIRVINGNDDYSTGIIDFECQPSISVLGN